MPDLSEPLNVRDFGACGNGTDDDLPAFVAAIEASGPEGEAYGTELIVPPGTYRLCGDLVVNRQMNIRGLVSAGNWASCKLLFDDGHGVVIAQPDDWNTFHRRGGAYTTLQDLYIQSAGDHQPMTTHRPLAHGVHMRATAQLIRCGIVGFSGNGVYIDSYFATNMDQQHVNDWRLDGCWSENNRLWGVYSHGYNSQAGGALYSRFVSNGLGGIYDSSFLGNTYVGCRCESNLDQSTPGQAFRFDGPLNRSTVIGLYTESDLTPGYLGLGAVAIGGTHGAGFTADSTGMRMVNNRISPLPMRVEKDGHGQELFVGMLDGSGVLGWQADGESTHTFLRYEFDQTDGLHDAWTLWRGNQRMMSFPTEKAASGWFPGTGRPGFPGGVLIGGPGVNAVSMQAGSAAPTSGTHKAREIVWNASPAAGAPMGWVCTVGGSPGTWRALANIT